MEICWCSLLLIFSIFFIFRILNVNNYSRNLPPIPLAIPVLGHLHHLKTLPHCALQDLSKGSIIYLHFGCRGILLISSHSVVEQCFTKNDIIFANGPDSLASKILATITPPLDSPHMEITGGISADYPQYIFSPPPICNILHPSGLMKLISRALSMQPGGK